MSNAVLTLPVVYGKFFFISLGSTFQFVVPNPRQMLTELSLVNKTHRYLKNGTKLIPSVSAETAHFQVVRGALTLGFRSSLI